jgi:hypothetical protein
MRQVITAIAIGFATVAGCADTSMAPAGGNDISFNWDVRPILSENCFQCHGPDQEAREAGLRLDLPEFATERLEGPRARFAIVPGDPDSSELIWRINTSSADDVMPPESTHKTLSDQQKETLRRWIADGAQYQRHWAYVQPVSVPAPGTVFDDRIENEIDAHVFARIAREGIAPSAQADRETLINRVSLTLTGLPPTLEQIDAFVADERPDAYERLVDRLLASPRYAEHMSAYWMDLARWSESDGFLDDHHDRWLWPWRDWVIQSFHENMPFDQFGTWQLAGDLMPDPTREQILATAYLRVGKRTTENGAIEEEYKAEYMIERTDNALGTAFMGLTLGCARCHDHKYDPVSQHDYYSLGAFFNSNDEPGIYAPGYSGVQGGPTLPWPESDEQQAEIDALTATLREAEAMFNAAADAASDRVRDRAKELVADSAAAVSAAIQDLLSEYLVAWYPFDSAAQVGPEALPPLPAPNIPPASIYSLGNNPYVSRAERPVEEEESEDELAERVEERARLQAGVPRGYVMEDLMLSPAGNDVPAALIQSPIFGDGVQDNALYFDETNKGFLGRGVGRYDNHNPFSFDFWFMPAERYENVPVINHRSEQNSGYTGYSVQIEEGHLVLRLAHSPPANMIALRSVEPLPVGEWSHIAFTYDGSSRAAGTHMYLNGELLPATVVRDTLTRTILAWSSGDVFEQLFGVTFGTRFRAKAPVGSALDELRVFDRALAPIEIAYLHDPARVGEMVAEDSDETVNALQEMLLLFDDDVGAAFEKLTEARRAHNRAVSVVPQVLVMRDAPEPIPTYVLNRGLYSDPGEQVEPRGLEVVHEWDDSLPANRLGLARWLFDPENPLTARVFVNRVWQMHFGRGLVETSEDFGSQGSVPTHPELLDWLAIEFVDSGWDVKALHRLIVTSATYRQNSDADEAELQRDARNELLARGPRWRMSAEMVRDSALVVSGLLGEDIGGQSAHPYQPRAIWNPTNSFYRYPETDLVPEDEHHRRTLYTFVKRNALHPTLGVFDFNNRVESRARRRTSNTPLQALTLMNDPQYVEAYRALAAEILDEYSSLEEQLAVLYRTATRTRATPEHIAVLEAFFSRELNEYASNPEKARALLDVGVVSTESSADPAVLAAMTQVAGLVMNSPDAYTVR